MSVFLVSIQVHSFPLHSALQQGHSLCKSEFSREFDIVLPLSSSSILWFPIAACFFFHVFSSLLFPSTTCIRSQLLHKMWPMQLAFLLLLCLGYSCPPWLQVTLLHFSHDRSSWSPSFSSTTFQDIQVCVSIYRVSQEEWTKLRESVPYVELYRYNPKHLVYIQSWTVTEITAREVWKYDSCYTLTDYQIHIKTGRNMWFL